MNQINFNTLPTEIHELICKVYRDDVNQCVSYNQIGIELVGWGESVEIPIGFYGF